jgi:hypothetical protein
MITQIVLCVLLLAGCFAMYKIMDGSELTKFISCGAFILIASISIFNGDAIYNVIPLCAILGLTLLYLEDMFTLLSAGLCGIILLIRVIVGFVTGGAAAGPIAVIHSIASSAAISGTTAALTTTLASGIKVENGKIGWDWEEASKGFLEGAVIGIVSGALTSAFSTLGSTGVKMLKSGIGIGQLAKQAVFNGLVAGGITATQNVINGNNGYVNIIVDGLFGGLADGLKMLFNIDIEKYRFIYDFFSKFSDALKGKI